MKRTTPDQFFACAVPAGDCMEYVGTTGRAKRARRYFSVGYQGRRWLAHRLAWTLHYGPIPDGLCVCHRCDNTHCINPAHLFLGTHADNMADREAKGRGRRPEGWSIGEYMKRNPAEVLRGESAPAARLTNEQVRLFKSGRLGSVKEAAVMLNVTPWALYDIKQGRTWAHIQDGDGRAAA